MSGWDIAIIGTALIIYGAVSRRLEGTIVTAAMVFVVAGYLLGPEGFGAFSAEFTPEAVKLLAEVTLGLVLFTDAASLDTKALQREASVPARLLGIGLPLTIAAGALVAVPLFPALGIFEAVVLSVLLAPTDAALGQAVVSDRRLPSRLRQGLNVESGLNDGVCVPLLFAAIALAELEERPSFDGGVLIDLVEELAVASAAGIVVAAAVAMVMTRSRRNGWMNDEWAQVVPLATAAVAYVSAAELGGSGFIASFVAGFAFGRLLGPAAHRSTLLMDEVGRLLSAVTFFVFAATVVGPAVTDLDAATVVYAVLSLTVVRMVPVALSLAGSGASAPTLAFAGWFGPRGLASIVFMLTIVEESGLTGTRTIVEVATVTVLLSVFAHGVSAVPLTARYARWFTAHEGRLAMETMPTEDLVRPRGLARLRGDQAGPKEGG